MVYAIIIHSVCIALFVASFLTLKNLDEIFAQDRPLIATIERFAGDARVRPIDLSLWRDVDEKQRLYEGDVLVTGRQSYATLTFKDGRNLDLDENSLITLTAEDNTKDASILITLVQGNIAAKANTAAPSIETVSHPAKQIKLVSAGKKLALNSATTSVQISKTSKDKDAGIKVLSGSVQVKNADSGKNQEMKKDEVIGRVIASPILAALGQAKLPEVIVDTRVAALPPLPASVEVPVLEEVTAITPKDQDFPEILSPKPKSILWTTESFDKKGKASLLIVMSQPVFPKETDWLPILEARGKKSLVMPLKEEAGHFVQDFDLSQIELLASAKDVEGMRTLSVELRPGLAINPHKGKDGAEIENQFSNKSMFVNLRSFADLPDSGIKISLSRISPRINSKSPWIVQNTEKTSDGQRIELTLNKKSDLASVIDILKGDESFQLETDPKKISGSANCFVRDGEVVAKASGKKITDAELRLLMKLFNAEFSFLGAEGAYLSKVKDFSELREKIRSEKMHSDIYVYDGSSLVPIKANLVTKDPKVIATLFEGVSVFFSERVIITKLGH